MNKDDFKIGDKVRHRWRDWYQQCVVVEIEDGCNGGIKVLCQDSPIYDTTNPTCSIKGFEKSEATFPPQDLTK